MWQEIISALRAMDFDRLLKIIRGIDAISFLKDPWVIGVIVVISIVLILRRMEKALITFLSIPALWALFEKTVQGDIDLEKSGHTLLLFAGGFLLIAGINVYVHFIR